MNPVRFHPQIGKGLGGEPLWGLRNAALWPFRDARDAPEAPSPSYAGGMTSPARRAVALVAIATLALAACAGPSGGSSTSGGVDSGSSQPGFTDGETSAPMPTDTPADGLPGDGGTSGESVDDAPVFTATTPTPRLPVTCAQFFAGLSGVSGASVQTTIVGTVREAALAQVGFIDCELSAQLSTTPVIVRAIVGVDIPRSVVQQRVDAAAAAGHETALGGQLSYSDCSAVTSSTSCSAGVFANGYFAELSIRKVSTAAATFPSDARRLVSALAGRVASWGAPGAAWQPPSGLLRWATDCATDVAATDAAVVAAIPFSGATPRAAASGDGFVLNAIVDQRVGLTWCEWGRGPSVLVYIVPGASWKFGAPGGLPGNPIPYPDALATFDIYPSAAQSTLMIVIDDSLLLVQVIADADEQQPTIEELNTVPFEVAEAILAQLRT